jgi:AraC-like DNA-binding protein
MVLAKPVDGFGALRRWRLSRDWLTLQRLVPRPLIVYMDSFTALFSRFVAEAMISGLRQGLNLDALLEETGVSLSQLHQPDFQLSTETGMYIVYRVYSMSNIPGVALRIGAQMRPSDFGHVGLAMISAPTLAASLGKLHKSPFGGNLPWEYTLIEADKRSTLILNASDTLLSRMVQISDQRVLPNAFQDARRYFLEVGLMVARSSWLYAGKQVMPTPLYVNLDFPQPPYEELYQRYFHCPVYFDQPDNAIVFRTSDLLVKPVGSNPDLLSYSEQQLDVSARRQPNIDTSWASRTRTVLKHGGVPFLDAETVARRLSVSCRVLRRHLADESTSFRLLLQQVREALARQYLERQELTILEVSNLLGYSETAAFSRSFKQWTGLSPAQYRQRIQK